MIHTANLPFSAFRLAFFTHPVVTSKTAPSGIRAEINASVTSVKAASFGYSDIFDPYSIS